MDDTQTLPTRRKRLATLIRLRRQRAMLVFGVAAIVPASAALAVSENEAPQTVAIGDGVAGVDSELPAASPVPAEEAIPAKNRLAALAHQVEANVSDIRRELGTGEASYYGPGLSGRPTASGERFDPTELTAAHRTLPFGSKVRVTSERTGKSVTVRINDRGPFHGNRVIDLSEAAARTIGLAARGRGQVRMALLN
ncbi:septal ring lytic transglycosylase RlpA family protein [Croceicoccus sp. YJ47]|uniref:septal ring lytic transglycosylase RlpA family protein n=1 Tax=Croceicoccus sp. YJ47 TaxID=2798724 RepID=UPI001F378240|nr:septal ring lytic transglycosylase RlpA family protein [Croceicoccus sp. YJ47]